jgi:phosphate transport system protein
VGRTITPHTSSAFDADLAGLSSRLEELSTMVDAVIANAAEALLKCDGSVARRAANAVNAANALHREIEEMAVLTIARRSPMAIDLRVIIGTLKTSRDLDQISSLGHNIAARATATGSRPPQFLCRFQRLVQHVRTRLQDAIGAFVTADLNGALAACRHDRETNQVSTDVSMFLDSFVRESKSNVSIGVHFHLCAANLVSARQHITHIAQTAYYVMEGRPLVQQLADDDLPMEFAGQFHAADGASASRTAL